MIARLIEYLFGCSHERTTWPITTPTAASRRGRPYVVCLDCGREFDYVWEQMRVGRELRAPVFALPVVTEERRA